MLVTMTLDAGLYLYCSSKLVSDDYRDALLAWMLQFWVNFREVGGDWANSWVVFDRRSRMHMEGGKERGTKMDRREHA